MSSSTFGPGMTISKGSSGSARMTWDVWEVMENFLYTVPKVVQMGAMQGLMDAGQIILDEAEPLVPKETGDLVASGEVVPTGVGGYGRMSPSMVSSFDMSSNASHSIMVQYNTPYATYVHEDTTKAHGSAYNASHKNGNKGGEEQAKWIPVAMQRAAAKIQGAMQNALTKGIQRVLKNPRRWGFDPKSSAMSGVRGLATTYGSRPHSFQSTTPRPGISPALSNYGKGMTRSLTW